MSSIIIAVIVIAIVVIVVIAFIVVYNQLVRRRNLVDNSWAQIEVQLKRRHDLVPNLVATVQGYATHERSTLTAVTAARAAAVEAQGPAARAQAENRLAAAVKQLLAVAESYPELKANQGFLQLQDQLADTENRVAYARQAYNDADLAYNNAIGTIPTNIVAALTGFKPRQPFHADDDTGPVTVSFPE